MILKRLFFVGGLMAFSCLGVFSQTVCWTIRPQYSSIETYSDQLYKVKSGYTSGLIDKTGQIIVPVSADSITDMRNGHSLVLKYTSDGRFKVSGVFHHDMTYSTILGEYYVSDYPFYSEDKLPVYNEKGRLGYIDSNGREVVKFNYVEAHPFCEGLALVAKGKGGIGNLVKGVASTLLKSDNKPKGAYSYVDGNGEAIVIQKNLGKLKQAYSFRQGQALVITEDDRMCYINPRGQLICEANDTRIVVDDVYAINPEAENISRKTKVQVSYNGPTTYTERNKIGYRKGANFILSPQFSDAVPFSNNYAIAAVDGKFGVLQLLADVFKVTPKYSRIDNSDQMLDCEVWIPAEWRNRSLTMYCKLSNGVESACELQATNDEKRMFSFSIPIGEKPLLRLEGEGLILLEDTRSVATNQATSGDLEVKILTTKVKANSKDIARVTIRVMNNSGQVQDVEITILGEKVTPLKKVLSLANGEAKTVVARYEHVQEEATRRLTVKLSTGKVVTKDILVEPFFNKL